MSLHGSVGQLNGACITAVGILLSCLCWNLARTSAGSEDGLNSMHNLVVEGAAAAVTAIAGAGADPIAVVAACATAVAMSADVGGAGPGAAVGAAGAGGAAGTGAGPKPAVESAMSVPHCRQFNPGRKCNA